MLAAGVRNSLPTWEVWAGHSASLNPRFLMKLYPLSCSEGQPDKDRLPQQSSDYGCSTDPPWQPGLCGSPCSQRWAHLCLGRGDPILVSDRRSGPYLTSWPIS